MRSSPIWYAFQSLFVVLLAFVGHLVRFFFQVLGRSYKQVRMVSLTFTVCAFHVPENLFLGTEEEDEESPDMVRYYVDVGYVFFCLYVFVVNV
jgi:hypothetical protein